MIQKIRRGFTLIEVMIVVAIIGILAAIAIPNFIKFQCRSKQSEAKTNLKSIFVGEIAYHGENDRYLNVDAAQFVAGNELSVVFVGNLRYNYDVTGATPLVFTATADGTIPDKGMANDIWTVDQVNNINQNIADNTCD